LGAAYGENTFYIDIIHSIYREQILLRENTFCRESTHSR
jgi:hypothetical protein